jgi:hypothetical protein
MKKIILFCLLVFVVFFSSCIPETQPTYYLSPMDVNANYYHAIPLKSDSLKSAVYTSFAFTGGGSNKRLMDGLYAFHGGIHRAHNFGIFQAYYGAGIALGSYQVKDYYRVDYPGYNYGGPYYADTVFHLPASNNFFGAYGFNGGVNVAISSPRGYGELRIGMETSLQNEFGKYLSLRKSLPDSSIDINATNSLTKTIGGYLEFLGKKRRHGTTIGYKISAGGSFISPRTYTGDQSEKGPFYFSNTFHISRGKVTGFCQFNFGNYTTTFQTGVNYRLTKSKKD